MIDLHNQTMQVFYAIFSNMFLLTSTYFYTRKKDIRWTKVPGSKIQMQLAIFIFAIDFVLVVGLNQLYKIHSNVAPWLEQGHVIVLFLLIVFIVKRNGETTSDRNNVRYRFQL